MTMDLWIKNRWRIPYTDLKQRIWDTKRENLNLGKLRINVFDS